MLDGVDRGLDLGDHAAGNRAVGDQAARLVDRQFLDQLLRAVEHARHVGEQQQALGLERARDRARESIGIHVEGPAVRRGGDRRQHRNEVASDDLLQHPDIDLLRLAHEAEVDDLLDVGARVDDPAARLAGEHEVAVFAAQPDRASSRFVDVRDDLLVDGPGQHHLDDLDGRRIGDAQAGREFRFDAQPGEHRLDLRAAAMHDHGIDRGLLQQDDVAGERAREFLLAHGVPAVFHHDGLVVVALHVGQCLGQDAGLVDGCDLHGRARCGSPSF